MKTFTVLLTLVLASFSNSQTKMINHKSHSGSKSNFSRSLSASLFDKGESNFGMAPQRHVRNSKLDSVILLSEKVAVMVTSESCHYEDYDGRDKSKPTLWSAGRDTVYDHEVFNSGKSVDEIKKILKNEYYFANQIDQVVFLGFDGSSQKLIEPKKVEIATTDSSNVKNQVKSNKNKNKRDKKQPARQSDSMFTIFLLSLISMLFRGTL